MKAILPYKAPDGKKPTWLLFDTEKSKKVCDIVNSFGYKVQTMYISSGNILFAVNNNKNELETLNQSQAWEYVAKNFPEKFIEFHGEVEEA